MPFHPRDIVELTAITTAAAIDPKQWNVFLERAANVIGPVHGHILGFSDESDPIGAVYHGYDDTFINDYLAYYSAKNPWAPGWMAHSEGSVLDARQMCPDEELITTEWYNDWIKPQDDLILGGGSVVAKSREGTFLIGANFPRRAGPEVRDRWLVLLRLLMPQLQNAWQLTHQMAQMKLGGTNPAILIVRPDKRLAFVNDDAADLLENGTFFAVEASGRIVVRPPQLDQWLNQALWQIRRGTAVSVETEWRPGPHGARFKLSGTTMDSGVVDAAWPFAMHGTEGLCLMLTIKQEDAAISDSEKISKGLGITIAEAQVVAALIKGQSPREVAEQRSVSLHTVRNQIKSAMLKSGTRRQTQLVSKALSLMDRQV